MTARQSTPSQGTYLDCKPETWAACSSLLCSKRTHKAQPASSQHLTFSCSWRIVGGSSGMPLSPPSSGAIPSEHSPPVLIPPDGQTRPTLPAHAFCGTRCPKAAPLTALLGKEEAPGSLFPRNRDPLPCPTHQSLGLSFPARESGSPAHVSQCTGRGS